MKHGYTLLHQKNRSIVPVSHNTINQIHQTANWLVCSIPVYYVDYLQPIQHERWSCHHKRLWHKWTLNLCKRDVIRNLYFDADFHHVTWSSLACANVPLYISFLGPRMFSSGHDSRGSQCWFLPPGKNQHMSIRSNWDQMSLHLK